MEAVASIISVVGFCLGAVRTLYETVEAVRDSPQSTKDLLSSLDSLHSLLTQLNQLALLHSSQTGSCVPALLWQPLGIQTQKCSEELQRMREKSSYLLDRPSEEGLKRVWSSVKTVLREKDFQKMEHRIQYHVSMFGVLLEIVNRQFEFTRDKQQEVANRAASVSFENLDGHISSASFDVKMHVDDSVDGLKTAIGDLAAEHRRDHDFEMKKLRNIEKLIRADGGHGKEPRPSESSSRRFCQCCGSEVTVGERFDTSLGIVMYKGSYFSHPGDGTRYVVQRDLQHHPPPEYPSLSTLPLVSEAA